MMRDRAKRWSSGDPVAVALAAGVAIVLVTLVALVLLGSQVSAVLSHVGSAVGPAGDTAVGVPQEPGAAQPAPTSASDRAPTSGGGGTENVPAPRQDALIVRTGQLALQVGDVDAALARAAGAIGGLGGYIGASNRTEQNGRPVADVTYRVPVARWDDALVALRATGDKVISEQTAAQEVTAQAVDLDARIKNLRATEAALQGVLAKATKIPDILDVQSQLSTVRDEIERLVAQRALLGDQAALGTIEVSFAEPVVATVEAARTWDPGAEVDAAVAALVDIGQQAARAGIWFAIVWLPVGVVLGVVLAVAWFLARRLRRALAPSTPTALDQAGS
jgi:hypothetical protein